MAILYYCTILILHLAKGAFSMNKEKMISKTIQFPPELLAETKEASKEMNMSFSELVRTATCLFLKHGCQDKVKNF